MSHDRTTGGGTRDRDWIGRLADDFRPDSGAHARAGDPDAFEAAVLRRVAGRRRRRRAVVGGLVVAALAGVALLEVGTFRGVPALAGSGSDAPELLASSPDPDPVTPVPVSPQSQWQAELLFPSELERSEDGGLDSSGQGVDAWRADYLPDEYGAIAVAFLDG